ncbi:hypothetical protein DTO006G1_1695 [Penicillium roqueforti]|nr:hypothetical protein CBS147337_6457 [Penicillium roqueforti]KAI2679646.1 hypothetical protein CBS147355_4128 [Penicillium roqueforti]KAI2730647.1 hypothetical protein CBS147332_2499 [Penicillium roqueforti]KAI2763354.1 hypothetical protein DTO006G1_1695 [Penicillium roqueforti]KAI3110016.1 hypothetical protein CBS147331_5445 [Penicillium roqueforti]
MLFLCLSWLSWLSWLCQTALAQYSSDDLMSFVTLPDIRAVKFNVQYQNRERVSPGYWFVAPYLHIGPDPPSTLYEQYQIGPHIYDGEGRLIWTGSQQFENRNVFDFKVVNSLGPDPHLSMVLQNSWDPAIDTGYGVILTNDYQVQRKLPLRKDLGSFDIHEFNILDDGKTALVTVYLSHEVTLEDFGRPTETTWLETGGYAEIDLNTAEVIQSWDSYKRIPLPETVHYNQFSPVEGHPGWDYVHINSVDKNEIGDYLISSRFANTIYLISCMDGNIMWRLGGKYSDFEQDFTFSKQHDAKFIESNGTHHIISFLNNASDEEFNEENISSSLFVELDTGARPMTARAIRRYNRPDGQLSRLRGNTQLLPNDNVFTCWSKEGYISEYAADGELLMTANFTSSRYSSYRGYKFEFTGRPTAPPDMVASVYGTDATNMVTTFWVSWNGATDVAWWRFYAQASEFHDPVLIGNTSRSDFETMYIARGYLDWVSVEAVDVNGTVLGRSEMHRSKSPDWKSVGYKGKSSPPIPADPSIVYQASDSAAENKAVGDSGQMSSDAIETQTEKTTQVLNHTYNAIRSIGGVFSFVLLLCLFFAVMASYLVIRGWRLRVYQRVRTEDGGSEERAHLAPLHQD